MVQEVFLRAFYLIFILLFCFRAQAQLASFENNVDGKDLPYPKVAIGIASPGPGVSRLGHAFLLFMTTPKRFSESYAVQFNVSDLEDPQQKTPEIFSFFGVGKRFSAEAVSGLSMMNRYRAENRAILLFPIEISPDQIKKLWNNLRTEHLRRKENIFTDYNFLSRNCLTESLRYVNDVLEPQQKKFEYLESENNFQTLANSYFGLPGLYIQNAPYAVAPQLAKHPLVQEKPYVVVPAFIVNARKLVLLEKQTLLFLKECRPDTDLRESVVRIIGQPEVRESQAYLNFLSKIKSQCSSAKALQMHQEILQTLLSLTQSNESVLRIEGYLE